MGGHVDPGAAKIEGMLRGVDLQVAHAICALFLARFEEDNGASEDLCGKGVGVDKRLYGVFVED